jgi:hypothetical protein
VSPAGAFGPQFGELWAKAAVLAHMVVHMAADVANAPAMAMSFILVMVFRWFQRPFCWVLRNQRTPAEKVAGDGAGRPGLRRRSGKK